MEKSLILNLLVWAFSREEIEYLNRQPGFQQAVAHADDLVGFEQLCVIGENLLQERAPSPSFFQDWPETAGRMVAAAVPHETPGTPPKRQ